MKYLWKEVLFVKRWESYYPVIRCWKSNFKINVPGDPEQDVKRKILIGAEDTRSIRKVWI